MAVPRGAHARSSCVAAVGSQRAKAAHFPGVAHSSSVALLGLFFFVLFVVAPAVGVRMAIIT